MSKQNKRVFNKIVHLDQSVHGKLKLYVINKQIQGEKTSIALEVEKAILSYIKSNAA